MDVTEQTDQAPRGASESLAPVHCPPPSPETSEGLVPPDGYNDASCSIATCQHFRNLQA